MSDPDRHRPVLRFLELANRGQSRGASGGEQRCARVRELMLQIIEETAGVDPEALDGVAQLVVLSGANYSGVKDILESGRRQS